MRKVINRKIYDTERALLIATDYDPNWSNTRNIYLYKTKRGKYFVLHTSCYEGERAYIEPVSLEKAERIFEENSQKCEYEEAFPGVVIEEA